jgi:urease accessory protein UreH
VRHAGSVAIACDAAGGRSRLRTIRTEGLSRSSRAFHQPEGAIRVMLSTLGPGVLAGDRFTLEGSVDERASLVAAGQMATPVFAGASPSRTDAEWLIADGATLLVAGEPLLLEPASDHAAGATFCISGRGCAIVVDTFGLHGSARLAMHTQATIDGKLVYRDAFAISGEAIGAFGTVAMISADAEARAAFITRAEPIAREADGAVRIGFGETVSAVVIRLTGARVWDVRAAALAIAGVSAP